jgi:major type 1 subunit fimbrin (pilin)
MLNLKTSLAVLGVATLCASAQAFDGEITFHGMVTTKTCTVSAGTDGTNTVQLPTVSTTALKQTAQVAGLTTFPIKVTGCMNGPDKATGSVLAQFSGDASMIENGLLKNQEPANTAAANVQLQLLDKAYAPISVGISAGTGAGESSAQPLDENGNAEMTYRVQYFATGVGGSGNVLSRAQYSITYP